MIALLNAASTTSTGESPKNSSRLDCTSLLLFRLTPAGPPSRSSGGPWPALSSHHHHEEEELEELEEGLWRAPLAVGVTSSLAAAAAI